MTPALALLVAYSVALIAAGLWVARLVRTSGDFFVAGRRLSAPLLGATVLAANIGAGSTVGAGGLLSSAWVNVLQLVVLLGGFLAALPVVVSRVGGVHALAAPAGASPHFTQFFASAGPGSGVALLALLGPAFIISPGLLQKVY